MSEQTNLDRTKLKEVVLEQRHELENLPRGIIRNQLGRLIELFESNQVLIIKGIRRCGKSTLLLQLIDKLKLRGFHYLNFEDERLVSFDTSTFNVLLEIFYEVNDKQKIFIFDEIQVVENWELFIRRLHTSGNKIIITGSNATLLSQELGTKLTGRHIDLELFPFAYSEYLIYQNYNFSNNDFALTEKRSVMNKHFSEYLVDGGMPIYLHNPFRETISAIYEDVIIRDILRRYAIKNQKIFRELALYLTSNCTSLITYQKLSEHFKLGSVNTIIKYLGYLENCYYLFLISPFFPSVRKQINAPKKVYIADNVFVEKIGFSLFNKEGALLENLVFLELRRLYKNIFYYKTKNNLEVDFLVYNESSNIQLIQVSWSIADPKTKAREINALIKASEETSIENCWILTHSETELISTEKLTIHVVPIYQWLLHKD
ncbi:MAG: ATP-binding protein [Pseudomonadota bacterium]|nr:ATP-binding protein [Pseudomonadota bacterium]